MTVRPSLLMLLVNQMKRGRKCCPSSFNRRICRNKLQLDYSSRQIKSLDSNRCIWFKGLFLVYNWGGILASKTTSCRSWSTAPNAQSFYMPLKFLILYPTFLQLLLLIFIFLREISMDQLQGIQLLFTFRVSLISVGYLKKFLVVLLIGVLLGEMGSDYIAAPVTYPFALRHTTVFHLSNGNNWLYLSIAFSKPSTSFAFAGQIRLRTSAYSLDVSNVGSKFEYL